MFLIGMSAEIEMPPLSYIYGHVNPGNSPPWYSFYARSDGTAKTPSSFDSLIDEFVKHLDKPENKNRRAISHNNTPDEFNDKDVDTIELLLKNHNEKVSGLAAEAVAK